MKIETGETERFVAIQGAEIVSDCLSSADDFYSEKNEAHTQTHTHTQR